MFLRYKTRKKDGKEHRDWSVVENRRVAGGRVVQVTLSALQLRRPRQWGACWLACGLWEQLQLDAFWQPCLPPCREGTRWLNAQKATAARPIAATLCPSNRHQGLLPRSKPRYANRRIVPTFVPAVEAKQWVTRKMGANSRRRVRAAQAIAEIGREATLRVIHTTPPISGGFCCI